MMMKRQQARERGREREKERESRQKKSEWRAKRNGWRWWLWWRWDSRSKKVAEAWEKHGNSKNMMIGKMREDKDDDKERKKERG